MTAWPHGDGCRLGAVVGKRRLGTGGGCERFRVAGGWPARCTATRPGGCAAWVDPGRYATAVIARRIASPHEETRPMMSGAGVRLSRARMFTL